MNDHRPEVADVFRTYEKDFFAKWGHVLGPQQRKAFEAIRDCRTAALGGHVEYVEQCADMSSTRTTPALWGVFSNGEWCAERACFAGRDAPSTLH